MIFFIWFAFVWVCVSICLLLLMFEIGICVGTNKQSNQPTKQINSKTRKLSYIATCVRQPWAAVRVDPLNENSSSAVSRCKISTQNTQVVHKWPKDGFSCLCVTDWIDRSIQHSGPIRLLPVPVGPIETVHWFEAAAGLCAHRLTLACDIIYEQASDLSCPC